MRREFISRVGSQTCEPELEPRITEDMKLVSLNMGNVFQFGTIAAGNPPSPPPVAANQTTPPPSGGQPQNGQVSRPGPVAPARPNPHAAPPAAPNHLQIQEAARVVPSDQKRRIDFIYWVQPDCSTPDLPSIRILEQPRNGKLAIERGTGFTNFQQSNPRFECNKHKSDGVVLESHALRYLTDQHMKRSMVHLQSKPLENDSLEHALTLARTLRELPFDLNLWQAQNIWYDILIKSNRFLMVLDPKLAEHWKETFLELGRQLSIAVEELVVEEGSLIGRSLSASIETGPLTLKALAP